LRRCHGVARERLLQRFLLEHRDHAGMTTSMLTAASVGTAMATCGCGAFFESCTNADGRWSVRIGNASCPTSSTR